MIEQIVCIQIQTLLFPFTSLCFSVLQLRHMAGCGGTHTQREEKKGDPTQVLASHWPVRSSKRPISESGNEKSQRRQMAFCEFPPRGPEEEDAF